MASASVVSKTEQSNVSKFLSLLQTIDNGIKHIIYFDSFDFKGISNKKCDQVNCRASGGKISKSEKQHLTTYCLLSSMSAEISSTMLRQHHRLEYCYI